MDQKMNEKEIRHEVEASHKEIRESLEQKGVPRPLASLEANVILLRQLKMEMTKC